MSQASADGDGDGDGQYETIAEMIAMIRVIALTGCRRSEIIGLRCDEVVIEGSCLSLGFVDKG